MISIKAEDLAATIVKELSEYRLEITDGLKEDIRKVSNEALKDVRENSPKRTGEYKKGWSIKVAYEDREDIRIILHNRDHYQLTNLLEDEHASRNGGMIKGRPHIGPAEQRAAEKLQKRVKVLVRK